MTFLSNQAFAIVDAQKEPDSRMNAMQPSPIDFVLPSTHMLAESEENERMKLSWDQSDASCQEMYSALQELREKDSELMAMNPTASSGFKDRYTQVQTNLEQHIQKASAHVVAQTRNLEKINELFKINERKSKQLIEPIEEQLRGIQHETEQTKAEILEYETRLKNAKTKLSELGAAEVQLKTQITKVQAQHHPQRADLTTQRNNWQFKLHSVHREQNCYTHLRHIATESYKHLESWSQCNISRESDTRRILLSRFYDCVEKYVGTLIQMLHFLGKRVGWMQMSLQRYENEGPQRKAFFGNSLTIEDRISADRRKMEMDRKMIEKLQGEIDTVMNTACSAACKWRIFEHTFNELWHKITTLATQFKVNLNSFVKLKSIRQPPQAAEVAGGAHHYQAQTMNGGGAQPNGRHPPVQDPQSGQPPAAQGTATLPQPAAQEAPRNRGAQHSQQPPLKIINNTTNKSYNLQRNDTNVRRGKAQRGAAGVQYQNQPPAHSQENQSRPTKPPVTKNFPAATADNSKTPQGMAQRQRPPRPSAGSSRARTTTWGQPRG